MTELGKVDVIQNKIYTIRGKHVMLDSDLAEIYQVETRALNQAVKRNRDRFPDDFMFQLTKGEYDNDLISQIVTSNSIAPNLSFRKYDADELRFNIHETKRYIKII